VKWMRSRYAHHVSTKMTGYGGVQMEFVYPAIRKVWTLIRTMTVKLVANVIATSVRSE